MNLVERAKNIITTPKTEWAVVASEEPNIQQILMGYVLPLALIPAIASVIGWGILGTALIKSFTWGIAMGLVQFISAFITVYLAALVINMLAPSFGSEKNMGRSIQLVAYSYTPFWVGGILNILPFLSWLGMLFGLYGLYLMYVGLPFTMKTPQDKNIVYLIVSIIVLIIVYWIIAAILTSILLTIFGLGIMSMAGMH
jgi:hypothetical protein